MRKPWFILCALAAVWGVASCGLDDDAGRQYSGEVEEGLFSFYAVGHFYGSGERDAAVHPHPAFVNYVPTIANNKRLDFGVLLGDIVISPSRDNYNAVIECMEKTGKPYYAIPGNHDGEGRGLSLFEGYFGKSERYFRYKNNLFILLNPIYTRVEAIIGEEGLKMIQSALVENRTVHNIFVFTHELIWLDRERPGFKDFYANMIYDPSFAQQFYETVLPMFDTVSADVYFIAGDAGKYNNGMELFYGKNDGITYIATGLGSNTKDNILQFDVTTSGEVFIQLIALNGTNPNALGHIEDYAR